MAVAPKTRSKRDEVRALHKAQPKMPVSEIASTLGISRNTAYKHLRKGKRNANAGGARGRLPRTTPVAATTSSVRSSSEQAIIESLEQAITLTESDLERLRSAHTALVG